ncbi:hypothetical protein DCW30_05650 [Streptomyces alfalfae]|uniref:Uncharacterized protein n=1 Tax=Streptomyces alfalfae TaxID=1642299 RepID=A0ABN4VUY2_9ACTN|nr:hypothetical protein [Streptomyces alfalfae]APY88214.1 hypothetical protein A7J05_23225 [Streptomyces alfalfae]AYA18610.1 hypothetical protein D3X13_22335 [Streptomyces fradiae]RXX46510.1 hypothetical protein DCW30_05650 [Streptomyces alfalfae]RZM90023.1 hypothetical protein D4104_25585 [Streptomyces alfalfae]
MKGQVDIDAVAAVCAGRNTPAQVEAVARLVDQRAQDDADREHLLDVLGLTTSRRETPDA